EKDQAAPAVEKAEPENVAVEEQAERAEEQRRPVVGAAQRPLLPHGVAADLAGDDRADAGRQLLVDLGLRPAGMAQGPLAEAHADVVDHRLGQTGGAPGDVEMLVVAAVLAAPLAAAEQAEVPDRVHAAMADRAAEEMHQP